MTTIAYTIRSISDDANSVVAEFNTPDARDGVSRMINYLTGVLAGARPGYISIDIDSATYAANYVLNGGSASGDTTIMTITSDEQYQTIKNELGQPATAPKEAILALINYLTGCLATSRNAYIAMTDSVTQNWEFGRAAP